MSDEYTKFLRPAGDTVAGAITAIYPASEGGINRLGGGLSGLLGAAGVSLGEDPKPPAKTEAQKFDGFGFEPRRAKPQQNLPLPPPLSLDGVPTPPDAQTLASVPPESTASPELTSDRDAVAAQVFAWAETERLEALIAKRPAPGAEPVAAPNQPPPNAQPAPKAAELDALAKTMKSMKPEAAALLLQKSDTKLAAALLKRMKPAEAGAVMDRLKPDLAAELVATMATMPSAPPKGGLK